MRNEGKYHDQYKQTRSEKIKEVSEFIEQTEFLEYIFRVDWVKITANFKPGHPKFITPEVMQQLVHCPHLYGVNDKLEILFNIQEDE